MFKMKIWPFVVTTAVVLLNEPLARAQTSAPTPSTQAAPANERHGQTTRPPAAAAPQKPPAPKRAPPRPAAAAAPPSEIQVDKFVGNLSPAQSPELVQHAKNGGITRCLGAIEKASSVIAAPHSGFSRWNRSAPNGYMFHGIAVEAFPSPLAPRAASVVLAAPAAEGCDAATVQAIPTARPCTDIAKEVSTAGPLIGALAGLALYQGGANSQWLLMPTAGNGCMILSVTVQNVAASNPPAPAPAAPQATPPAAAATPAPPATPAPARR